MCDRRLPYSLLVAAAVLGAGAVLSAVQPSDRAPSSSLFTRLSAEETGVTFSNTLKEGPRANVLTYEYFSNGGGVAAGDLNGDGRPDLYFTSNQGKNALYLNEGAFQFREVTEAAGVADGGGWTTGVVMADVNGDGRLDLYVCKSGYGPEAGRNKLYIHQGTTEAGTPRFDEQAEAYGLDAPSSSTHATFFDYDRDGDLDLYLLNHPIRPASSRFRLDQTKGADAPMAQDKLYRNDRGTFVDVTEKAGLVPNASYGLSVTVGDINRDGWPDLYVANDFIEEDYLYVNQGDGTFEGKIRSWLDHTSYSSMGSDIADVTNDGRPEIYTLDMLPEEPRRKKLLEGPAGFNFFQRRIRGQNHHYQYQRNMLHLNNGDSTFSEIGQMAGVSNTDWSWAPLLADFDLDGHKDLYVTNGYRHDFTNLDVQDRLASNLDYLKYLSSENPEDLDVDLLSLVQEIPSTPIPNYAFRNQGNLRFKNVSTAWGVAQKGFSSGAAYADFNNDGAPDLAVNNIDQEAFIYRNNADHQTGNHFLSVELDGPQKNRYGVGAKVTLSTPGGRTFYQEMMPARGFQSSVEPELHFGVGKADTISLRVTWPDQTQETRPAVPSDQTITLHHEDARSPDTARSKRPSRRPLLERAKNTGMDFTHRENGYVDFERQPLLPHMLSRFGPALAVGDANGDGRDDVFVGGAQGQPAGLFLQQADGQFREATPSAIASDRNHEDVDATFFDADGDGDLDLYVVSGGKTGAYQDRLYVNDGSGGFTRAPGALPSIESSGGAVAAHDYNGDGRVDLFVGGRVWPGEYPLPPRSYLLKNTGGRFEDVTAEVAPLLFKPGMVSDALWQDLTGDGQAELVVAGEWMPIRVFQLSDVGLFDDISDELGLEDTNGWWYSLAAADLNGNGRAELVAGNRGLNAQVRTRPEAPAAIYAADFARDGGVDPIMTHYLDGREYPVYWRKTLVDAVPPFEPRFTSHEDYATSTIGDILTDGEQNAARRLTVQTFETSLFSEQSDGTFRRQALPREAQFAPVQGLVVRDVNADGRPDLLLAGNDFTVRPQWGRADAEKGTVLINRGGLTFGALRSPASGFYAPRDVRALELVGTGPAAPLVVAGNNDAPLSAFSLTSSP